MYVVSVISPVIIQLRGTVKYMMKNTCVELEIYNQLYFHKKSLKYCTNIKNVTVERIDVMEQYLIIRMPRDSIM